MDTYEKRSWNRIIRNFGEVEEGAELDFLFVYYGDKQMKSIKPGCGCTKVNWNEEEKSLEGTFSVGDKKLKPENAKFYRETTKTIKVEWQDGSSDMLILKAMVLAKGSINWEVNKLQ